MKFIIFIHFTFLILISCNSGNEIQKETQNKIISHKKFLKKIAFRGKIIDKIYCNKCNFNAYQIKIKAIDTFRDRVEFSNLSFPPYYYIISDYEITLSVNKKLYDNISNDLKVIKETNSNYILIDSKRYILLSNEKYKWIPKEDE